MTEVLVVDDDISVLQATARTLKAHGYEATLIESAEEALRVLKKEPLRFSVILLDWKLRCPIDGDMILMLLKKIFPGFKTPIIFITAHTRVSSKYLMRLGAYDTLAKPLTSEQLIDAIERALHKKVEEDPHQKAPAELNSQDLKKHEMAKKIIQAISIAPTLADAAHALGCSRRSLYRWLQRTGLHYFMVSKEA